MHWSEELVMDPRTPTPAVRYCLLALSAETDAALAQRSVRLRSYLREVTDLSPWDVAAVLPATTPAHTRGQFVVCRDRDDALDALGAPERALTRPLCEGRNAVTFLLPGLGEQYP